MGGNQERWWIDEPIGARGRRSRNIGRCYWFWSIAGATLIISQPTFREFPNREERRGKRRRRGGNTLALVSGSTSHIFDMVNRAEDTTDGGEGGNGTMAPSGPGDFIEQVEEGVKIEHGEGEKAVE